MINIKIEGLNKTMGNLMRYSNQIKKSLIIDVNFIGEEIYNRLQSEFWDKNVTYEFDTSIPQFTIMIGDIVICKATGQEIQTGVEKQVGHYGAYTNLKEYFNFLIGDYLIQARERIQNSLHIILK